jgi:hypothetical protein
MGLSARWLINISWEMTTNIRNSIFKISSPGQFEKLALEVFDNQAAYNPVYKDFIFHLGIKPGSAKSFDKILFLPIEFFRSQKVLTATTSYETFFESSGTTGITTSKHYVTDLGIYEDSFISGFKHFYGPPEGFLIAALLPSYAERENSSLVFMMNKLISLSKEADSGFYINNPEKLVNTLLKAKAENRKAILLGVSYALLDLAEKYSPDLSGIIVMETGGMKGRRKEITREELHGILKTGFNIKSVHSEYGMTELMSQAYSKGEGKYYCPPWMRIFIRDPHDPVTIVDQPGVTGGINIIDLANLNSCSFIATNDLGKLHDDGGFEVLGRFDNSDTRGCNLMVS